MEHGENEVGGGLWEAETGVMGVERGIFMAESGIGGPKTGGRGRGIQGRTGEARDVRRNGGARGGMGRVICYCGSSR